MFIDAVYVVYVVRVFVFILNCWCEMEQWPGLSVVLVAGHGVPRWALGLRGCGGRQPGLRLILVGVHPFSLGDRCGPSGKGF